MSKQHIKFQVPKELSDKVLQLVEMAKSTGKLRRGTNEATKSIERGQAKLIIIAEDVDPIEIVMHLPILCEEKKISYVYVPSKLELGRASGLDVQSAVIAVTDVGEGRDLYTEVVNGLKNLKAG
ncbi:MAG TPA: 50S ribosomal protein L7Ae [archaeon]|nr:50S ribosomal protein L7Ae [archaeon]